MSRAEQASWLCPFSAELPGLWRGPRALLLLQRGLGWTDTLPWAPPLPQPLPRSGTEKRPGSARSRGLHSTDGLEVEPDARAPERLTATPGLTVSARATTVVVTATEPRCGGQEAVLPRNTGLILDIRNPLT